MPSLLEIATVIASISAILFEPLKNVLRLIKKFENMFEDKSIPFFKLYKENDELIELQQKLNNGPYKLFICPSTVPLVYFHVCSPSVAFYLTYQIVRRNTAFATNFKPIENPVRFYLNIHQNLILSYIQ